MGGDRFGEFLEQPAEQLDLRRQRLGRGQGLVAGGRNLGLETREPASDFRDLASKVGRAARKIRDLVADVGPVLNPGGDRIEKRKPGQRRDRDHRRLDPVEPEREIEDRAERAGDEHDADRDENGTQAHHDRPVRSPAKRW